MVFEKLREIICDQLQVNEDEVTMEANIRDDFDADSLDFVDIVMSIEDEFNVEVPDEAIDDIQVVGDLVKFIEENM